MKEIPKHLKRYIVEQNQDVYTYEDQAVWRFIMRQLFYFLKDHAHESYVEGLKKTGISIDHIPSISEMDKKLSEYGWRAVPVSGFIPPAAFMSFQAHNILPIASEMRSIDHILYTPAPDIVHEAAGHAPILIDPDFTNYLGAYAEVAEKALISSEDLALYEAIRDLSDTKEHPNSTKDDIAAAEEHLQKTLKAMTYVSEAQYLGRMNWWTAEYGLIGELKDPKIFGAGLLSSIGEARSYLTVPKLIPLDIHCLDYSYDITEKQPQLFVAKSFDNLVDVLNEMSEKMAFKIGGLDSVKKAIQAKSICTVVLEDGSTFSGVILDFESANKKLKSLKVKAPCLVNNRDLIRETKNYTFDTPQTVESVYGGPSSFEKYPMFEDFKAKKIMGNKIKDQETESLLKNIRDLRESNTYSTEQINKLSKEYFDLPKPHWLAALEIFELDKNQQEIKTHLLNLQETSQHKDTKHCIDLGLNLLQHE